MVVFRKEYGDASLGLAAGFVFIKNKSMNNFWAYFVFILGLIMLIISPTLPGVHTGWLGIIFIVWGLHSLIGNIKKEIIEELKKK